MFARTDAQDALEQAYSQQLEAQQQTRRRGGGGKRQPAERRERINWASPERAGLDHPGRISEAEKAYVRVHLDEVNDNRRQHGQEPLDPSDPEVARRYGLDEPVADTEVV